MKTLVIEAMKEVLRDELSTEFGRQVQESFGSLWKIVVADRGFVLHGRVTRSGEYIVIEQCSVIRSWGTPTRDNESGLGYLAKNGATANTKLDPQPTTRVHELQVVQLIDCDREGPLRA